MTSLLIISLIWKVWLFQTNNASICIFQQENAPFSWVNFRLCSSKKRITRLRVLAIQICKRFVSSKTQHSLLFSSKPESYQTIFFYLSLQNKKFTITNITRMKLMAKTMISPAQIIRRTSFLTKGEITFSNYHFRSQYTISRKVNTPEYPRGSYISDKK